MMKEKIVFVFPGQGSQYVGMSKDIFDEYAIARHTFEQVSDMAHNDIAKVCFVGPRENLNKPKLASLGTFAHSISVARIIEQHFDTPLYNIGYAIAGHSMGQYSALHCAGSLTFDDAVWLLSERANYMSLTNKIGGGMACIVGLSQDEVESCMLSATGHGYAAISNHNAKDQFTISGHNEALDAVISCAKQKGAKIAKRLNVEVPAHCALMENAKVLLRGCMESVNITAPKTNWFSNRSAQVMSNPLDVKDALADQMTHGVRWLDIMEQFPRYGITSAYELGPAKTLTGLIRRANIGVSAYYTNKVNDIKEVLQKIENVITR